MQRISIIYPEYRTITAAQIATWASDAYANGEIARPPRNLGDAIALLNDAGLITTANLEPAEIAERARMERLIAD